MDVIVLAGGEASQRDSIFELTGNIPKSMLKIAGKPMVQWVLDALSGSSMIDTIALIGLDDSSGLSSLKPLHTIPDAGSLIANIQKGAEFFQQLHPAETHIMSVSADIPAITPAIVDQMAQIYQAAEVDIYYAVIDKSTMEERFPGSKRTYIKMKDVEICGGDLNAFNKSVALHPAGLWKELVTARKKPLKQASLIGWDTLLLLLFGRLTLEDTVFKVCRKLGITGKAVITSHAEIGMDIDKPFQFELVENDLMS